MSTKSRESIYGSSVRHSAEQATEARKEADRLACVAWNQRMLGFKGPAQPSPAPGDALNAGFLYLEVRCFGCDTHQTVALNIVRRPKATPIHELERYMRCKDCSQVRGYPFKRNHLVALRSTKISASDAPSTWWPGERLLESQSWYEEDINGTEVHIRLVFAAFDAAGRHGAGSSRSSAEMQKHFAEAYNHGDVVPWSQHSLKRPLE